MTASMQDTTASRNETGDSTAPFWYRRPVTAALAGFVTDIMGYGERGQRLAGEVEMASLIAPLIISFGDPFLIALGRSPASNDRWSSFAAGLYAGPVMMDSTGSAACVQVNFTPQGAHRFFGMPMDELADRMVTLDDLGDRDLLRLKERLGAERDWSRRLDITEQFLIARFAQAPAADAAVDVAYARMLASRGRARVSGIARELGWSRKHLNDRFHREFGLAPKSVARMVRFQNVLTHARRSRSAAWADIAAACGYADQAHLAREFLAFAGMSPSRWLARSRGTASR
jgi:AraC-like DNA-binding protein